MSHSGVSRITRVSVCLAEREALGIGVGSGQLLSPNTVHVSGAPLLSVCYVPVSVLRRTQVLTHRQELL